MTDEIFLRKRKYMVVDRALNIIAIVALAVMCGLFGSSSTYHLFMGHTPKYQDAFGPMVIVTIMMWLIVAGCAAGIAYQIHKMRSDYAFYTELSARIEKSYPTRERNC